MDHEDLFKRFFGSSFPGFEQKDFRNDSRQGLGQSHLDSDIFGEMRQQMEEMDRQMNEVFRIFHIFEMPSGIPHFPESSKENPRDNMLKAGESESPSGQLSELPSFSSPRQNFNALSEWLEQFSKAPMWNRIHPAEKADKDLDGKSPSNTEIADLFMQKKEESPAESRPVKNFSFWGNSCRIQRVIGADGSVEERRTVRDSSGREETTVTRKMGDSSHTVTTIRDDQGREETHETFNNVGKEKLPEFEQQWKEQKTDIEPDSSLQNPSQPSGILSDNRSIFRKIFGF